MANETANSRWSIHIVTVLASVPVLLAACFCHLGTRVTRDQPSMIWMRDAKPIAKGWPLRSVEIPRSKALIVGFVNAVWSVGAIVGTAAVWERIVRNRQMQLRSCFFAIAAIGIWLGLARYGVPYSDLKSTSLSTIGEYAWWVELPLAIGSCCLIYGFLRSAEAVFKAIGASVDRKTPRKRFDTRV